MKNLLSPKKYSLNQLSSDLLTQTVEKYYKTRSRKKISVKSTRYTVWKLRNFTAVIFLAGKISVKVIV